MNGAIADATALAPPPRQNVPRTIAELTQSVSASRLSNWQSCRLKFYFRYLAGILVPTKPALYIGKVIHSVLQAFNHARWRGVKTSEDDRKDIFENVFENTAENLEIDWNGERETQKQLAWSVLEAYVRHDPIPPDEKPVGVEVSVEADLGDYGLPKLIGVIDLVRPNERIVDYKTTSRTPNQEILGHLHETQLACYGVLYRDAVGQKETGFDLIHLVKLKKEPKVIVTAAEPMTQRQETRLFRLIESYVAGLEREDFVPSPGLQCASCEYFANCRAWR